MFFGITYEFDENLYITLLKLYRAAHDWMQCHLDAVDTLLLGQQKGFTKFTCFHVNGSDGTPDEKIQIDLKTFVFKRNSENWHSTDLIEILIPSLHMQAIWFRNNSMSWRNREFKGKFNLLDGERIPEVTSLSINKR